MLEKNRPPLKEEKFSKAIIRPSFLKFLIIFTLLLVITWLIYGLCSGRCFVSQESAQEKFNKIYSEQSLKIQADTYGGKTPEQTLNMFISALDANDPVLAAKYFMPDDYGSTKEWEQILQATYEAGNFKRIANELRSAKPEKSGIIGDSFYAFSVRDKNGDMVIDLSLIFNGHIWKIESI